MKSLRKELERIIDDFEDDVIFNLDDYDIDVDYYFNGEDESPVPEDERHKQLMSALNDFKKVISQIRK